MDERVYTFPKGIGPKVNVLARLEFELAYYDSSVRRLTITHGDTRRATFSCLEYSCWSQSKNTVSNQISEVK